MIISETINKINLDYEDFTNQAYMQTVFSRKFAIGAGIEQKRVIIEKIRVIKIFF